MRGGGEGDGTCYKGYGTLFLSSFFINTKVRFYFHCKVLNSVKMITDNTWLYEVIL